MSANMRFGSLFAGIGGFDLGFHRAGMECAFQVEIDPQASRVLAHHWPDVLRIDDVRKAGKKTLPSADVICGGFPCQDLSVAGKRGGLAGSRSGLFYEMVRITHELRPSILVWENVPGLFSSDAGRDFGRVLRALGDIGYFGAWRVLDAQFFGLAQRRRRIFGVFARGRAGVGRAAEILALSEGVQGNSAQGREAGQDIAYALAAGVGNRFGSGRDAQDTFVAATLRSRQNSPGVSMPGRGGEDDQNLIVNCLDAHMGMGGTDDNAAQANHIVAHTLRSEGHDASEDGTGRGVPLVTSFRAKMGGNDGGIYSDGTTATFTAGAEIGFANGTIVRRLTPKECCRLQGFPDDWLDITPPLADSAKYRLLGNAVAVPVAFWIGRKSNP